MGMRCGSKFSDGMSFTMPASKGGMGAGMKKGGG